MDNSDYFNCFWGAGMRRLNKKAACKAFNRVISKQKNKEEFVDMLVLDIQQRIRIKQFGFDKMHPTTYLNGERWEDENIEEKTMVKDYGKQSLSERSASATRRALSAINDAGNVLGQDDPTLRIQMDQ